VLDPIGVRYALSTVFVDPKTGVMDAICLMREANSAPFTNADREAKQFIAPHLRQALSINRVARAQDVLDAGVGASYHSLGHRERSVAIRYAAGISCKEIAREFGISPSTVSNQLGVVF
jgi:DNA-binding CsgD family transcriptional regulator